MEHEQGRPPLEDDLDDQGIVPPVGESAGWYRDPTRPLVHRYWDGRSWHQERPDAANDALPLPRPVSPAVSGLDRDTLAAAEFWWDTETDQVVWSREAYLLHGYAGARPEVSRELMLSHVADADRDLLAGRFEECREGQGLLRSHHQLLAADGVTREVLLVAAAGDPGAQTAFHGFLVDVGPQLSRAADLAVVAAREGNGQVQRAVGVLCAAVDVDPETALEVLRTISSERNVKLRDLAGQIVAAAQGFPPVAQRREPITLDQLIDRAAPPLTPRKRVRRRRGTPVDRQPDPSAALPAAAVGVESREDPDPDPDPAGVG